MLSNVFRAGINIDNMGRRSNEKNKIDYKNSIAFHKACTKYCSRSTRWINKIQLNKTYNMYNLHYLNYRLCLILYI